MKRLFSVTVEKGKKVLDMETKRQETSARSLTLGLPPCILAVDDDEMSLMMIERILGESYEIVKVTSGKDALAYLSEHTVDLVLLDYMMPEHDGITVLTRIRETLEDRYTSGHSERVATYSREIARRAGDNEEAQATIYAVGLLHDIGKIGVPIEIINKTSRLTDGEYEVIKSHTTNGASILKMVSEFPDLSVGARSHHERYDGRGYPDGLKGEEIPRMARIIAVADSYDAMTSRRSYRDALPQAVARSEIVKGRGTQFDPQFADIMLQMIDEDTEYTMRDKS